MEFIMGVDSLKSVSDVSTWRGVLDPAGREALDMYWGWNDGFIFFKLEGSSPQIPLDINGNQPYAYHIGGFGRGINNIKKYSLPFGIQTLNINASQKPRVHLAANIDELFKTPSTVSIFQTPNVAFDTISVRHSTNTKDMFRFLHID